MKRSVPNDFEFHLDVDIHRQPDDTTCGPTCLHALYDYWQDPIPLRQVIEEVPALELGGTLGVFLARHALDRGYRARIYTFNLQVFDPTWFAPDGTPLPGLSRRLMQRREALADDERMVTATTAYADFVTHGGELRMIDLTARLISGYLRKGQPILTGLTSTWLYRTMREFGPNDDDDAIRGQPSGHFVLVTGYDAEQRRVRVADPMAPNPLSESRNYSVSIDRLVCAILLGIVTWDANLVVLSRAKAR